MASWIDTHAHLDDERFHTDLPAVLERAQQSGVNQILSIGVDRATSENAVRLAQQHQPVFAVVGIQPNHVAEAETGDWDAIVALAQSQPRVVGLGESGLDRHWDRAPFPLQEEYFTRHLELSRRLKLPLVIHCREAEADVVRMLRADYDQHGPLQALMHSFAGSLETAQACLEMGVYLSFAGMLTYKTAGELRAVAAQVPHNRLLVETDCPYLAPSPMRGKRNEPAFVVHTASVLAELVGLSIEALAMQTTQNARQLFERIAGGTGIPDSTSNIKIHSGETIA